MAIRDRVTAVLGAWSGANPQAIDTTQSLNDLWTETRNSTTSPHSAIPFSPDGLQDLLAKLRTEFTKPGPVRKDTTTLKVGSFKPGGEIDTVEDLVKAVVACPNLPATAGGF